MSYNIAEDAGDADVLQPGRSALWGQTVTALPAGSLAGAPEHRPRASAALPGLGWGAGLGAGLGCAEAPRPHGLACLSQVPSGVAVTHLQDQADGQHAAGCAADQEAQQQEDTAAQQLHHKHLEAGRGASGAAGPPSTPHQKEQ